MQQPLQGPRHPAGGKRRFKDKHEVAECGSQNRRRRRCKYHRWLERNEVLTDLNLSNNQIRAEGAAAIAEALRGNAVC